MDRDQKLAKLNKQSEDRDQARQDQLKEVADSLENAVDDLKKTFGLGVDINGLAALIEQISELKGFKDSVDELKSAISELPDTVKVDDIDGIVDAIREIELKSPDVILPKTKDIDVIGLVASIINAINALGARIEANKPAPQGQKPLDYVPYRRVIKVGNAFQFDDTETPVAQGGGGGGGTPTVDGYVPVVNPDGSVIGGASSYDKIIDLDTTPDIIYIGQAAIGSALNDDVWQIKKVDTTSGAVIGWANSAATFTNVWDNRASLTYSRG